MSGGTAQQAFATALGAEAQSTGVELYVAPNGNDANWDASLSTAHDPNVRWTVRWRGPRSLCAKGAIMRS